MVKEGRIDEYQGANIMSVQNFKLLELAQSIKSWDEALTVSIRIVKINHETVRLQMGYDKGTFSRILSGDANLPPDRIKEFCEIVGHDLPLYWLAHQSGYELRVLPKTLEETIEEQKKIIEEKDKKLFALEEMFKKLVNANKE